jgi:SAM-dependent methyltransferase
VAAGELVAMMVTRERLIRGYFKMERVVAPRIRYAQLAYEDVLKTHVHDTTVWLDLGCGRRILPPWRRESETTLAARTRRVVGVDVDQSALADNTSIALKCRADAKKLPFMDGTFDLVTANMVVEHLEDPGSQFRETGRVMKPGGLFIIHTPNALGYPTLLARVAPGRLKARLARSLEGRQAADVYPAFYRANSRRAIDALARGSSFKVVDVSLIVTTPVFGLVLPIALLELLWSRVLNSQRLKNLRGSIIAILQKSEPSAMALGV